MINNIESLEDTRIRLAEERRKRRHPMDEKKHFIDTLPSGVDSILRCLKAQEPNSDNLFFRLAIIDYELGDVARAIVYSERFFNDKTIFKVEEGKKVMFRDGFKDKAIILAEGKLAMADTLTQLYLLCISLGWDWDNIRELGAQHLKERHEDLKRDGWTEVKK